MNNNIISNINNHNAMTKDIPEIDDLTKGINDPDISLTDQPQDQSEMQETSETKNFIQEELPEKIEAIVPSMDNIDKCWNSFLSHLCLLYTSDAADD